MPSLYLVSTPIGNLGDLSRRAVEILGLVSRVLAEDTRQTRKLLVHLGIRVPLVSLHSHNEEARRGQVLDWLGAGEDLALVSDAGTPTVSDPGYRLVAAVSAAGYPVVPIPGPSAVLAALAASGLPADRFLFLGFPPRKGPQRRRILERVAMAEETVVLFESPGRLANLLVDLLPLCGSDRRVVVAREITKLHEEFLRSTLPEALQRVLAHPPRGEVTLVVEGVGRGDGSPEEEGEPRRVAAKLLAEGVSPRQAARRLTETCDLSRNRAYRVIQDAMKELPPTKG